jgi:hypothetical protein
MIPLCLGTKIYHTHSLRSLFVEQCWLNENFRGPQDGCLAKVLGYNIYPWGILWNLGMLLELWKSFQILM